MATSSHVPKDDISTLSGLSSISRSFKRIRMATKEDFLASYSILAGYIKHPEAAYSVEELIVNPPEYHSDPYTRLDGPPVDTGAQEFNDELHDSIVEYTKSLDLGDGTTDKMLQALDLTKRRLKGEEPEEPLAKRPRLSVFRIPAEIPNYDSAVAVLLISLCPNIVTLRIYNVWSESPLGQFLLKNNYGLLQKPALQKLREVQLHPVNCQDDRFYDYLRTMDYFRYFHRLPALNSLSLEGFEDYQAEDTLFPPKTSSGIKKVHIGHSDMTGEMISNIMLIPKTLEEFSLSTYGLMNCDGGTSMLHAKTLGKGLLQYRRCLKVLDLDARVTGYHSSSDDDDDSEDAEQEPDQKKGYAIGSGEWYLLQDTKESDGATLLADDPAKAREYPAQSTGSLHDFTALTHLSIRIGLILGYDDTGENGVRVPVPSASYRLVDALPPNLGFLRLYGYQKGEHPDIDAHVTELLEKKAERFPDLGEIEGVDEFLPGVPGTYQGDDLDEDEVWKRPTQNLNWVEA